MKQLMTFNAGLKKAEEIILIILVGSMATTLIANVVARYVLQDSLNFAEELGAYLLVAVTYLGSGYAVRRCKHIRMTALIEATSHKKAKIWSIVNDIITTAAFAWFAVLVGMYMMNVMEGGAITPALQIPRWVTVLPVVIGLWLTALQYALLVAMNLIDKDNFWIGTERKFGELDEEEGGAA